MLEQITSALSSGSALAPLATAAGANEEQTHSMLASALPALLGGLGRQSASDDGAAALLGVASNDKGELFGKAASFFGRGDSTGLASGLVQSILGGQRNAVEQGISESTGVGLSSVTRFLPMIAPMAISWLGRLNAEDALDADGLRAALGAEFDAHDQAGNGELLSLLDGDDEADNAGFVTGLAGLKDAGGLAAMIPAAVSTTALAGAGAATTAVAAAAAATAAAPMLGRERSGLGWLLPALALFGAMIAGLVLWQCNDNSRDIVAPPVVEAVEAPTATAIPEPTAAPTPDPTATPVPTATPEPTAVPAPAAITIAEIASERGDLGLLLGLATDMNLAGPLSDADAGPFTVFAPIDSALGAAAPSLDDQQVQTTVLYHVVEGLVPASALVPGATFETTSGEIITIDADGNLPSGVTVIAADLEADNGLLHVLDGVMIPGSVAGDLAASEINELLALEPIQFATNSADILPESVATLDNAVAVLTSLPPGVRYEVQGHTDSTGDDVYNQTLSDQRANSVVTYLTSNGVDADMLEALGYGETQLKANPEETEEDRATNRRIEFVKIS